MNLSKGTYVINKPKGPTSFEIIRAIKRDSQEKRIGHGGTLDPLASGVLVVAVGREYTRDLDKVVSGEKEYLATIELGKTSQTYDSEGPIEKKSDRPVKQTEIEQALESFTGEIKQRPPVYSALKVKGQPAYKMARSGQTVELEPRSVKIKTIEIVSYKYPELVIRVTCGPGVYIRSLAHDLGEKLGTGAYLSDLVRTRVGDFKIENAIALR